MSRRLLVVAVVVPLCLVDACSPPNVRLAKHRPVTPAKGKLPPASSDGSLPRQESVNGSLRSHPEETLEQRQQHQRKPQAPALPPSQPPPTPVSPKKKPLSMWELLFVNRKDAVLSEFAEVATHSHGDSDDFRSLKIDIYELRDDSHESHGPVNSELGSRRDDQQERS